MKFGLKDQDWKTLDRLVLEPLRASGCSVWIFGSRARGDHREFSDVDILFDKSGAKSVDWAFVSKVREEIENSNFPYKVDLVEIAEIAQSYRDRILLERVLI